MAAYNRIILVGNLTRDPEIRYVDGGGKAVTTFPLAVNRRTKQGDDAMFIDVIAWDRLGEVCSQYLRKGMSALVDGRLAIRNYETKDGEKRKAIEVVASDMQMLGSKGQNGSGGPPGRTREGEVDDFDDSQVPF